MNRLLGWLKLHKSKFYGWQKRFGLPNDHNGKTPRDFWLEEWEKEAIRLYYIQHPFEGYRRLTYMMIDEDIVACAPSTVYRVLKESNLLCKSTVKPSKKGTGFIQPEFPDQEWHTDITYLNISGTFYYLSSILDGYSRRIMHWELSESMKEADIEMLVLRALEMVPGKNPKIISDNGPQYISKDFKEFIRLLGMTHARTAPYYPQSNGKQERMQGTVKQECIRKRNPQSKEEAQRFLAEYVEHYNHKRLHSAIGYVTPMDKYEGREKEIFAERDRKLEEARQRRKDLLKEQVA
jgi:putative transposase